MKSPNLQKEFDTHKMCVIIPTYNNQKTIAEVVNDCLEYTTNVIVVNDGSTDATNDIITKLEGAFEYIHYAKNRGKGYAMRTGFKKALELGYEYAITIDSDGQHYAKDLQAFVDNFEEDTILIGSRNLEGAENVPGGSKVGNKISSFWFWVETGVKMPDTQSGYRMYPIRRLAKTKFFTTKYEFEIEVLVRSSWKDIAIKHVPIDVLYQGEERVSHFRPTKDFLRITALNTVLVLLAALWYRPVQLIRNFSFKKVKQFFIDNLVRTKESTLRLSASVAWGVFWGIVPIWGGQLFLALLSAHWVKLNKIIVGTAAQISIPPMIPLIIFLSYKMGGKVLDKETHIEFSKKLNFESIAGDVYIYAVGACVLAVVAALAFGMLTFILLKIFRKNHESISS